MNPPVRLCCGEVHFGTACRDGKVMCCLCFDRFEVSALALGPDGKPENVCVACAEAEAKVVQELKERGEIP